MLVWLIWSKTVGYLKITFQEGFHISYMKDSLFWKIEKQEKCYLGQYEK